MSAVAALPGGSPGSARASTHATARACGGPGALVRGMAVDPRKTWLLLGGLLLVGLLIGLALLGVLLDLLRPEPGPALPEARRRSARVVQTAAPGDEPAQAAPLTEELAMLDQALAAPAATPRTSLRDAAAAILAAWDDDANREGDMIGALDAPMEALRTLLASKPARAPREPGAPRKSREGTKQELVLAMLRRPEGATVAQIADTTGWAQHTVRGFFAGLKKKGHAIEVRDRVRQVGPNNTGA
jgi:hypothetical protein